MAIADRTRKILWAKAGGRCSLCRVLVVTEGTDTDDPSVFGEEAHIVARGESGPRAKAAGVSGIDSYENLILLCSKHHKQVDDQVDYYTVERLRDIKQSHEEWVASQDSVKPGPVRLISDPTRPPAKALRLFTNGSSFWNFFDGSYSFNPSWPDGLKEEDEDLVTAFFDELRDWMDVSGELSFKEKLDAGRSLGERMKELGEVGYFIGARERNLLLTGGVDAEPQSWRSLDIEIQPVADAQLVDQDGSAAQGDDAGA